MREFLKPTKITWIAFVVLVALNISAPFVGFYLAQITDAIIFDYVLVIFPVEYQLLGLMLVFDNIIGINVTAPGGGEIGPNPNFLGWILIAISLMITLTTHYVLASVISRVVKRKTNIGR